MKGIVMPFKTIFDTSKSIEGSCYIIDANTNWSDWETLSRSEKYDRLESRTGDTPIKTLLAREQGTIFTKYELANMSNSHYDRAFLKTLRNFEAEGLIQPGDELRDITSGSAGISLAFLGEKLGYKVRITVPDELPENRLVPMHWFGAEVVKAGPGYIKQASELQAQEIQALRTDPSWQLVRPADRDQRAFIFHQGNQSICYLNHSENLLTPEAFRAIGHEAVAQLVEAPSSVVLAMGNWTTIAGIAPVLRKAWPGTQIIGYEGENTDIHDNFGTTVSGIPLRFRDDNLLDKQVVITNEQRDDYDRKINEWLPPETRLGHSSLMGLAAADAEIHETPGNVLTIGYDEKRRY
jgi:cysteine synthase